MEKYDYFLDKKVSLPAQIIARWQDHKQLNIIKKISESASILEIGPGTGSLAEHLIKNGYEYHCIDRNEKIISHLKSLGAKTISGEVPPIALPDNTFEFVIFNQVIEHMPSSTAALELLKEVKRVLKPGGKILMYAPNIHGWGFDFFDADYTHQFVVSVERIRNMFSDTGLQIDRMENVYGGFGFFPGFFMDFKVNTFFAFLRLLFPMNPKLLKAKIMFHPILHVTATKPGN